MKKLLFIIPILVLASCSSNQNRNTNDDYNYEPEVTHNYVSSSSLTIMKSVDKDCVVNYAKGHAKQTIRKADLEGNATSYLSNLEAMTYFETFTEDELYYRFYDGFQDSYGRVINLKEVWLFPVAGAFILKNQINTYEKLNQFNYQYQNTSLTAVKIGIKANVPSYVGTYSHYCVNSNTYDVASYKVNMTFSIPKMETPSTLCEANQANCNWQMVEATNQSQAMSSFQSDQGNLCTKSYSLLQGSFNYLQSLLKDINSSYNLLS